MAAPHHLLQPWKERLKGLLDRRYAQSGDLSHVDARLASVELQVERMAASMSQLEEHERDHRGNLFVAGENPDHLRKRLFEAHRIAMESARAIELILQAEVLIWQAIDAVELERTGKPYQSLS